MPYLIDFQRAHVVATLLWFHAACVGVGVVIGSLQLFAWRRLAALEQPLGELAVDRWAFVWTQPVLLLDIPWEERRGPPLTRHIVQNLLIYMLPVFAELCIVGALIGALADVIKIVTGLFRKPDAES